RRVPAFYNGMATGADWMSAASFVGMAGTLYALGYDGLAFVLGWTGGFVLVGVLLAPYLRKFGQYTVPDFLGARYGGNLPRALGVVVLLACSFAYLVAQVYAVGLIAARFLDIPFAVAVYVGLGGILVCSMLGGMRAVTWTQVAQYLVVFTAYLVPAVWLSWVHTGIPVPQLSYGQALARIAVIEQSLGVAKPHAAAFAGPDGSFDITAAANFFALILCLMVGTASLPHILTRYFTTPSVREARQSVAWSLFFIALVYLTAPAYAAFAKLEVYTHLVGNSTGNVSGWLADWVRIGLAGVCDTADAASALCKGVAGNADGTVQLSELRLDPDAIVLATPGISNMPFVITGLVAAGGLAAALATADGLLLAIANALSHDIYYRILQPRADSRRRLLVSRLLLVVTALVAASVAAWRPASIMTLVAWAFSIAASGLFPALVLGIWWKRASNSG
ncbi:MAG: VC_2705 family sodium/solute symporter, partial [Rhodospirillales bacterium]|nr:VC_2705 family sodium/solute symporter [Rhodospirillales bacterium]